MFSRLCYFRKIYKIYDEDDGSIREIIYNECGNLSISINYIDDGKITDVNYHFHYHFLNNLSKNFGDNGDNVV